MLADHQRTIENFSLWYDPSIPREMAETYFDRPDYDLLSRAEISWFHYCTRLNMEWCLPFGPDVIYHDEIMAIHASHIYAVDLWVTNIINRVIKNIPVGFVTNTCEPEWNQYIRFEPRLADEFHAWRSDIEGKCKADIGVFKNIVSTWILENLEITVDTEEVLVIDDGRDNCEAAKADGLRTFQYSERKPWLLERELKTLGLFR
jgi:FMN phosphatase YigB (HAD superfamily)